MAPELTCPAPLGVGVETKRNFCDVLTGRSTRRRHLIEIPPHAGPVTLTFDLHNRQTYSEEQVKAKRAYARYTASIGALTMDNTLISRAAIQSEFRSPADFWIESREAPARPAIKAVAPTGLEPISITIPEAENRISILGREAHHRSPRLVRDLLVSGPPDRDHQQRDDRIPSGAGKATAKKPARCRKIPSAASEGGDREKRPSCQEGQASERRHHSEPGHARSTPSRTGFPKRE